MFFMLSVPSPAARTSWRNMNAIPSAPSAIRRTMMARRRLPPERCTTAGLIPVMGLLLGMLSSQGRRGLCHAPRGSCQTVVARPTLGARRPAATGTPYDVGSGRSSGRSDGPRTGRRVSGPDAASAGREGPFGGVVDDEHLGQTGDPEDLEQAVLVAHQ